MSISKTISVTAAILFSALLLANGIISRQTMEQTSINNPGSQKATKSASEVKAHLEKKLPGMKIRLIEQSPLEGFYQAFFDGELIYVSNDGEFLFTGNLLELAAENPINHSQQAIAAQDARQAPMRAKLIAEVPESDMVVFKAAQQKYVITVFTDVDCGYCRKLHKEVPLLNSKGITVRYMAYPRAGIGSDAYAKLVSVWCSEDRMAAMDDAKLRRKFSKKGCKNPVANQYKMTKTFNLSGTPALILDDGELIGGYMPAENLFELLSNKSAATGASQASSGK